MDRSTNKELKELRDSLHSKYSVWNHSEKKGINNLSRDPDVDELEKIKKSLEEEQKSLESLRFCCENLMEEVNKEWRKL